MPPPPLAAAAVTGDTFSTRAEAGPPTSRRWGGECDRCRMGPDAVAAAAAVARAEAAVAEPRRAGGVSLVARRGDAPSSWPPRRPRAARSIEPGKTPRPVCVAYSASVSVHWSQCTRVSACACARSPTSAQYFSSTSIMPAIGARATWLGVRAPTRADAGLDAANRAREDEPDARHERVRAQPVGQLRSRAPARVAREQGA
jgi:hypothetical protein